MTGNQPVFITPTSRIARNRWRMAWLSALLVVTGCGQEPQFRLNAVHRLTLEKEFLSGERIPEPQIRQMGDTLTALFGTPDQPWFPAGYESLVSREHLQRASGPVSGEHAARGRGLYREHCAHCHGISGDGDGPTAPFLNPYPRDFRLGKFKFKSTKMYRPPTDEDLRRVLIRGIAGTAMPSFHTLSEQDLDALVDYVKYLSIRGQVERALLEELIRLEQDESLIMAKGNNDSDDYDYSLELILEKVASIIGKWQAAESQVVPVAPLPNFSGARNRLTMAGKRLFFGQANCVQCHGETGVGDGQTENYDDWTNEWLKRGNVDPNRPEEVGEFIAAGALPPRKIRPRNLRNLVFRGGSRPEDLFRRIRAGIEGTSMPAAPTLSDAEVWSIVAYLLELPFEKITKER